MTGDRRAGAGVVTGDTGIAGVAAAGADGAVRGAATVMAPDRAASVKPSFKR